MKKFWKSVNIWRR